MKPNRPCIRPSLPLLCVFTLAGCGSGNAQSDDPSMLRWGGDLLGGGSSINVAEDVAGDVIVAGGHLRFSGVAGGDYLGAGRTHEIGGRIHGDVRAAGNSVVLGGHVARNVTAAAQRVVVLDGATIDGNVYLAGQVIRVDGTVGGSVRAMGQRVVLSGTVDGSVDVRGGSLRVAPGAIITGDLTYRVAAENVEIDADAQISGNVNAVSVREHDGPPVGLFRALLMLAFLVTGAVIVAVFARTAAAAEAALRRSPAAALGLGLAWVVLVPICIAIIALTAVGIPLALMVLALYLISIYIGRAVTALWLGRLLLRHWVRPERGRLIAAFLTGGVILLLVCLIPFLGTVAFMLATLAGLGALVLAWRGRDAAMEEA